MFNEISKQIIELNPTPSDQIQTQFVGETVKKYLKPTDTTDTLAVAQSKVTQIGQKMQDNMINIIDAGNNLNVSCDSRSCKIKPMR